MIPNESAMLSAIHPPPAHFLPWVCVLRHYIDQNAVHAPVWQTMLPTRSCHLPPSPSCAAVSCALSLSGLAGALVAAHLPQLAALRLKNEAVDGWGRGKGGMGRVWVTTFAEDPNDNVRQSPHARHAPVLGLILSQRRSAATSSRTEASRP